MKFLNLLQEKDILHHITIRLYAEGFYSHGLSSERLSFFRLRKSVACLPMIGLHIVRATLVK